MPRVGIIAFGGYALRYREVTHNTRRCIAAFLHGGDDEVGAADAVAAGEDVRVRSLIWINRVRGIDAQRVVRGRPGKHFHSSVVVHCRP